jgi:hypothetical protein
MRWYAPVLYLWTIPNTLIGLWPVPILLFQRSARLRLHTGVIEITGGIVTRILNHGIAGVIPAAITFGHVVWATDEWNLNRTRRHERVHVRQYERWGPFFLPAYLCCSLVQKLRGLDHYRDNPFEREAYAIEHPHGSTPAAPSNRRTSDASRSMSPFDIDGNDGR